MKKILMLCLLAGCASNPRETTYVNLGWAKYSARQAQAECQDEVQSLRSLSMYLCMRAKGWEEK